MREEIERVEEKLEGVRRDEILERSFFGLDSHLGRKKLADDLATHTSHSLIVRDVLGQRFLGNF
jgi:hypothetical protein